MSTIVLRSVKGTPLTNGEVDANFSNLNTDKLEASTTATLTNKTINLASNTLVATSAQLAAAVTDETGTGALVFAGSPALTGTPTVPTAAAGTNTTQAASTAHVFAERTNTATLTNKTITGGTVNPTTLQENGVAAVVQTDIGTAPNEIPLNQYLGNLAYQDAANIAGPVGVGGDLTLNAGAINGVTYLNGSKVLTTGSALTFDGTNLGIGTSSPGSLLHLRGGGAQLKVENTTSTLVNITQIDLTGEVTGSGAGNERSILFGRTIPERQAKIAYQQNGANGQLPSLGFFTGDNVSALVERMRITSAGNVGIGTTSPGALLEVSGVQSGGLVTPLIVKNNTATAQNNAARIFITATNAASRGTFIEAVIPAASGNAHDLVFGTNTNVNVPAERMRITSVGNVGIGTTSPNASALLDVQSTTKGVRMPNMTTTQKNAIASPAAGLMVFDTTLAKLCVYTGSAWETITSA